MEEQAIRTGTAGNQGQYVSMPTKKSHPDVTLTMPSYTLGKVWEVVTATATGNQKQEVASNGLCLLLLVETEWLPKASWQWVCVIFSASTLYSLVGISFYVKWVKIDELINSGKVNAVQLTLWSYPILESCEGDPEHFAEKM